MSDGLHILQVVKSTGGVGQYMRWLVAGLHQQFRFRVICLSEGAAQLAADLNQYPGVQAEHLAMARYTIDVRGDAQVALALRRIIANERFDLIHAHASKPGMLARLAAIGSGVPVIYRPACFAFHDAVPRGRARLIAAIERVAAATLTAKIQCVCEDERALARRWRVGHEGQLTVIHTGIDPAPFAQTVDRAAGRAALGLPTEAPLLGSVGRLSPQKAPLDFVQAAAYAANEQPAAHFAWIGSGPLEPQARALVAQLGLSGRFHFLGERRNVPALLPLLDGFVLPSHWEGFSLSVLEAMAAGLPVIATEVMGTREALDNGRCGVLVPLGQPSALGQAMSELISQPERAAALGAAARARIAAVFTRRQMLERIGMMYMATARGDREIAVADMAG